MFAIVAVRTVVALEYRYICLHVRPPIKEYRLENNKPFSMVQKAPRPISAVERSQTSNTWYVADFQSLYQGHCQGFASSWK